MFGQITSSDKDRQIPMTGTYQVFLSFRGSDTRFGFTGNLYKALTDRGIHTFIDDEELQSGDQITPALMKVIQESRIAIPVLSTNYASSSFCLDELTHILDRSNSKAMLVLPVFYEVDPSDVRHQKGSYGDALAKHKERLKHNMDKLQNWKNALSQVANLSGYHFKKGDQYEYKFIEKIVEQVSKDINLVYLHVADYPVGLESAVFKVTNLLDVGSDDGAHMVGIHGMGGIGKSTLARAVYNNLIADNFDGTCFIANVREKSTKHGLEYLQSILFSEILKEDIIFPSCEKGVSIIKERFQRKKILLVLDDVDDLKQLKACVGSPNWFGLGSKIIITTRDTQLLKCHIKITYEVRTLDNKDALHLLTLTAFKGKEVDSCYKEVLNHVVTYASGLPLALQVIGSNLAGKSIQNWEDAIDQYERIPPDEIQDIFKVSFNALNDEVKSVFLDIACCFKGYEMTYVEHVLGAHYGYNIKPHLEVLVEKSLLKHGDARYIMHDHDRYTMHDLIEEMGKNIVNQESPDEPAERSRLWSKKDIIEVLEENKGTSKIKIICLDLSINKEMVEWNGKAFKKMEKLKTLIIENANFSKGPKCLPNSLRVLEWKGYPSDYLPSDFLPKKLVVCNLADSHIKSFRLDNISKKLMDLTVLNFRGCKFLEEIPDVSYFPNLEELLFDCCKKLTTIHYSIGFLDKLKILTAEGCSNLKSFPPLNLPSLQLFNIRMCSSLESFSPINLSSTVALCLSGCSSLRSFPEITEKMNNLYALHLERLSITELPWASFQNLCGLKTLYLNRCGVVHLPSRIFTELGLIAFEAERCEGLHWPDLEVGEELLTIEFLTISGCNLSDDFFDKGFQRFARVKELNLSGNNFTFLPKCIKDLQLLKRLAVNDCYHLREIRGIPPLLKYLNAANCESLSSSSKSMVINEKWHVLGDWFCFPGESVPDWFHQRSTAFSCSFWFSGKFPLAILCCVVGQKNNYDCDSLCLIPEVSINGKLGTRFKHEISPTNLDHIYFHILTVFDLDDHLLKKGWNQAELLYYYEKGFYDEKERRKVFMVRMKEIGMHVMMEEGSMIEDVRFTDPSRKRKLDDFIIGRVDLKKKRRVK